MSTLIFRNIEVHFIEGQLGVARTEGLDAVWNCKCDGFAPLLGRCQANDRFPETVCPTCGRTYEVLPGDDNKPLMVREI